MDIQVDSLRPEHRRRLQVVLGRVLTLAEELESLSRAFGVPPDPLAPLADDLPEGFKPRAPALAFRIREAAAPLLEWLRFPAEPRSLRQRLTAAALIAAIDVEDSDSRGLRGYGRLEDRDAARLDPLIERLRVLLYDIAAQAGGGPSLDTKEGHDARIQG